MAEFVSAELDRRHPERVPDEQRTVIDCVSVVMEEEIEHYRFAVRDLTVLESR